MSTKMTVVALVAVMIIAIGGYMFPKMSTGGIFGSTSCGSITCLEGGLRLVSDVGGDFESDVVALFSAGITNGASGTKVTRHNVGFCNMKTQTTTLGATSSTAVDCGGGALGATALTGVTAGDKCFMQQGTTTPAVNFGPVLIAGASASSTSGFITMILNNMTGATFTWTAAASTSWQYLCESTT